MNTTPRGPYDAKPLVRISHPSDFSEASEVAFAHALKIALANCAALEVIHVARHATPNEADLNWTEFPGVRRTLNRWGVLPADANPDEVGRLGLNIRKIVAGGGDPVETLLDFWGQTPPDLLVLATHQREGLSRLFHRAVAEPLARESRAMTLFVPRDGRGFVSLTNGAVQLRRILIPVDHAPDAQQALEEAFFLAQGFSCSAVNFTLLHVGQTMPTLFLPHHPGWEWEKRMVLGDAVEEILKTEDEWAPDLMVLATQGHRQFLDALRGSTTERVLRGARCPVLAVPAP